MQGNIYEDLNDQILYKKYVVDDDASSVNTDIPSDPWFDEQDINSSTPIQKFDQTLESNKDNQSFIYSHELDECTLKEREVDLYNDLIMIEDAEKRSKIKHDEEFENLKRELEKLQEADVIKSAKMSELLKENVNLKKSICSLYQTVKSEIELKDHLLAEANRKIDSILFRKNTQNFRIDSTKNQSTRKIDTRNKNSHKRRRSTDSPRSPHREKECKSSLAKIKSSNLVSDKSSKYVSERNCHISKDFHYQPLQKSCNERAVLQNSETLNHSENFRDTTETNNLFFNLVPKYLKRAFFEYEQSQIISLNRLKQSFINEHFNTDISMPSASFECTSKRYKQQKFSQHYHDSVNTKTLHNHHSDHNHKTVYSNRYNDDLVKRTGKISRSNQQDLISLFRYKKEKIPFLDKRKFGLLNDGKDLIPKNLL